MVTDPPYNVGYTGKTKEALTIQNDKMTSGDFYLFLSDAFKNISKAMKPGASFYVFYASQQIVNFWNSLNNNDLSVKQELLWVKNILVMGRQDYQWKHEPLAYGFKNTSDAFPIYDDDEVERLLKGWKEGAAHNWYSDRKQTTVLNFDKPVRNGEHPTMKPIELLDYLIKNSSKPGDVVLDPFAGSGSTLIACEQDGRTALVMELDPHYADVIIKRWETFTGETARLLS